MIDLPLLLLLLAVDVGHREVALLPSSCRVLLDSYKAVGIGIKSSCVVLR